MTKPWFPKLKKDPPKVTPFKNTEQKLPPPTSIYLRTERTRTSRGEKKKATTLSELFEGPSDPETVANEKPSLFAKFLTFFTFWRKKR